MDGPRTEAGRALYEQWAKGSLLNQVGLSVADRILAIEREAAAELWQQGYAAGLKRGRQPDNHPEAVAAPALPDSLTKERLADAVHAVAKQWYLDSGEIEDRHLVANSEQLADGIAEYLRLSQPSPDEPTPPVAPLGETGVTE